MIVLALDTCLGQCAACLYDSAAGKALAEEALRMERGHAEALAPMVSRLLAAAGKAPSDVGRVAVTTGPGTFTGVRIGLSFARAFGMTRKIPVLGLDTLQALRQSTDEILLRRRAVALKSGESGFCYLLPENSDMPEIVPYTDDLVPVLEAGFPSVSRLASWAAGEPAPGQFPAPVYLRAPDAKPQFRIRPAGAGDASDLARLHAACFPHGWSARELQEMLSVNGTEALAAEAGGEVMGFILTRSIAGEAEILTLAVDPSRRRLGLGSKLLDAALKTQGTFFLEVAAGNLAALGLYRKSGFAETGRRKAYYADGQDALLMTRRPGPV